MHIRVYYVYACVCVCVCVIALTALSMAEDVERGVACGFDDFVSKCVVVVVCGCMSVCVLWTFRARVVVFTWRRPGTPTDNTLHGCMQLSSRVLTAFSRERTHVRCLFSRATAHTHTIPYDSPTPSTNSSSRERNTYSGLSTGPRWLRS